MSRWESGNNTQLSNIQNNNLDSLFDQTLEINNSTQQLILKFESLKQIIKKLMGNVGREQFKQFVKDFGLKESISIYQEKNITDSRILDLAFPLFETLEINQNEVLLCSLEYCARDCIDSIKNMNSKDLLSLKPFQTIFLDLLDIPYINWIPLVLLDLLPLPKDLSPYYVTLNDKKAMTICPLKVKQALWLKNPAHFKTIYLPLLDKYSKQHKLIKAVLQIKNQGVDTISLRFNNPPLLELAHSIGSNFVLYGQVCDSIKTFYLQTGNIVFCNLRFDLLIVLQRNKASSITDHDNMYKLIWNLNAINIKETSFREKAKTILEAYREILRSKDWKQNNSLGMIFRVSFIVDWAVSELFNHIWKEANDFPELHIITDLIHTGLESRRRIRDGIEGISENTVGHFLEFSRIMKKVKLESDQFMKMSDLQKEAYFRSSDYNYEKTDPGLFQTLYNSLKHNPLHTLIYFHFLLNRVEIFDYATLKGAFNVMKNVMISHAFAVESFQGSWLDKPSQFNSNPSAEKPESSFITILGLKGFFFPLIQTLCRHLYDPKILVVFISNENFFYVFVKFLSSIILKYDFAHREALYLILHLQEIVKNHDILLNSQRGMAENKVIRFTQQLATTYLPNLLKTNQPEQFSKIYNLIFKTQNQYPEFQFDYQNAPELMSIIEFRNGLQNSP